MSKKIIVVCLFFAGFCITAFGQDKTVVNSAAAKTMLLGKHKLSLQWISWDYFGTATVTDNGGVFRLKGEQKSKEDSDYLKIDGTVTRIDAKEFTFDGEITMQISHINNGEPCKRTGEMTFRITGKRKYWRLQEMKSPCDVTTDYVDIFFK